MPLNVPIEKELVTKSDRVKALDFHPTENWVAAALYSGSLVIYDHALRSTIRTFPSSTYPLRCCKFIPRQKLVVCAGDDLLIRVYHMGSQEMVSQIEAHSDYIRCLAVHPTEPWLLSSSDDTRIKLWNTETWELITTFESHSHYVMAVAWHPTQNLFASASLDKTVRIWAPTSTPLVTSPNYQLVGHKQGVNCVIFGSDDSDMLISGGDDNVRIWNYASKQCLHVLDNHKSGINSVVIHPTYPLIISASEDTTVNTYNIHTFKLEQSLQFHMDRVWSVALKGGDSCLVGFGTDQGTLVLQMGKNELICSILGGKLVICKGARIYSTNIKTADRSLFEEGCRLTDLNMKELVNVELFPQSISHHPSGRFLAVCGEGEYVIATSQALRSKSFGKADSLVWCNNGDYCTLIEKHSRLKASLCIHRDFRLAQTIQLNTTVENIFGGALIAVCTANCVLFYDWQGKHIRSIQASVSYVLWSSCDNYVALLSENGIHILQYNSEAVSNTAEFDEEEGYLEAFDLVGEVNEEATSMYWLTLKPHEIGGVLVYTTSNLKLASWFVGGYVDIITFTSKPMRILESIDGYLFLLDREHNVINYSYPLAYAMFCLKVLNKQFDEATSLLESIDGKLHTKLAKFLCSQGHKEKALEITKDQQHRLKIALELNKLDMVAEILQEQKRDADGDTSQMKSEWKALGDAALSFNNREMAITCFTEAADLESLLLISTSMNDDDATEKVAERAMQLQQYDLAVLAYYHLNRAEEALKAYMKGGRIAHAVAFARTYCPAKIPSLLPMWQEALGPRFEIKYEPQSTPVGDSAV